MAASTFIIDCPWCKAKVAAAEGGTATRTYFDDEIGEPFAEMLHVGTCPRCKSLLAGRSHQTGFKNFDSDEDEWSDPVRVYPKPPKEFSSTRIPRVTTDSLLDADRSLQAGAHIAACVMLGRALEAVGEDVVYSYATKAAAPGGTIEKKRLSLDQGIRRLRDLNVIDDRLYSWSQDLRAFRNVAAHAVDASISREDAEDLQSFTYAIIEYVYDLTDRYEEFKAREARRAQRKKP